MLLELHSFALSFDLHNKLARVVKACATAMKEAEDHRLSGK